MATSTLKREPRQRPEAVRPGQNKGGMMDITSLLPLLEISDEGLRSKTTEFKERLLNR